MRTSLIKKVVTTSLLSATLLGATASSAMAQHEVRTELDMREPMTDGEIEDLCKEAGGEFFYSDPALAGAFTEAKCIKGSQVLFTCDTGAEDGLQLWPCEPGLPAPTGQHARSPNEPTVAVSEPSSNPMPTAPAGLWSGRIAARGGGSSPGHCHTPCG